MPAPKPTITCSVRERDAYFTVVWSPITRATKGVVRGSVPSVSGIYELYVVDQGNTPNLVRTSRAWYGGLRHAIREASDPAYCKDQRLRTFLRSRRLYFRYTTCDSPDDLTDVLSYLSSVRPRAVGECDPTGRFRQIYVAEQALGGMTDIT